MLPGGVAGVTAPVATPPLVPAAVRSAHPLMLELTLATGIDNPRRWVFWVPPAVLPTQ